jgi:hypothetical protein
MRAITGSNPAQSEVPEVVQARSSLSENLTGDSQAAERPRALMEPLNAAINPEAALRDTSPPRGVEHVAAARLF